MGSGAAGLDVRLAAFLLAVLASLYAAQAAAAPATSGGFIDNPTDLVRQTLWMHMADSSGFLEGRGSGSCCAAYMGVLPPGGSALAVGAPFAPGCTPVGQGDGDLLGLSHTWVVGVTPDRLPLANQSTNYDHYHWQPADMAFGLPPAADLTWYAGVSGPLVAQTHDLSHTQPPLTVHLAATLVLAHAELDTSGARDEIGRAHV